MKSFESRWLDYAWDVVSCPQEHIAACERLGGASTEYSTGEPLVRAPGYIGRNYTPERGILCLGIAGGDPGARGDLSWNSPDARSHRARQEWGHGGRSLSTDAAFLAEVRDVDEASIPTWAIWNHFVELLGYVGIGVDELAWTNLVRCRTNNANERMARACQEWLPISRLIDSIKPRVVLASTLLAVKDRGVAGWEGARVHPTVIAWNGRTRQDAGGRLFNAWSPEAAEVIVGELTRHARPTSRTTSPPSVGQFGRPYVKASEDIEVAPAELHSTDTDLLARGWSAHNRTQNRLDEHLRAFGWRTCRPRLDEPPFDIGWSLGSERFIGEVKSLTTGNEETQLRNAVGQVLRYRHLMAGAGTAVRAAIITERAPTDLGWQQLCAELGVDLGWPPDFSTLSLPASSS